MPYLYRLVTEIVTPYPFWIFCFSDFKRIEFDAFKNAAGSNSFTLTPQKWIETTNAIGMISKSGRYGGTFAHRDIAFEFASWISPEFKLYLITEFQRLKKEESSNLKLEWNLQRTLAKVNYHIHTDAIKENLIPIERAEIIDLKMKHPQVKNRARNVTLNCII